MSVNRFGHIDLRVSDMQAAARFYSKVLPLLGFTRDFTGETWRIFSAEGELPSAPWFGFTEEADHRPNSNRIAFWASSREEVDRLAAVLGTAGARGVEGPRDCPEYSPTYYAVFFEDPCGNRLEVCHRTD